MTSESAAPAIDFDRLSAELLRALRASRSQVAFSRRLGYRSNVARAWESGRRFPTARETLRVAAQRGVDLRAATRTFLRRDPRWLGRTRPDQPDFVANLLEELRGGRTIEELARAAGRSRFAVARFLCGEAEPRLPDFLRLVEAASWRSLDLVALLVDPAELPSVRAAWRRFEGLRHVAYEMPIAEAILRALELDSYGELDRHRPGWIARELGITEEEETRCLSAMEAIGMVRRAGARLRVDAARSIDTGRNPEGLARLKRFWAELGANRLAAGHEGLFSYRVFSVGRTELEALQRLHVEYYEKMVALIRRSRRAEVIGVANLQLFRLASPAPGANAQPSGSSGLGPAAHTARPRRRARSG